jgi:WD40 repeat protein
MATIFISYAREDQGFVRKLNTALTTHGHETWIDWKDIPVTAEWWSEIEAGIEGADACLFVLSPDSVASDVCERELRHAMQHNKRLIPLLHREVDAAVAPPALAALNWILFRAQDNFDAALHALLQAIETDLDWVHAHTRLVTRAAEWERNDRNRSYLLRGSDLDAAEAWLARGAEQEPLPTALQTQYIVASRQDATKRQRMTIGATTMALVVVTIIAIIAYMLYLIADERSRINLARRLATEAQFAVPENSPQLRTLLATEALLITERAHEPPVPAAANALYDALTDMGGVGLDGQPDAISTVAISPNSQWLVAVGEETAPRLWHLTTADPPQSSTELRNHGATVQAVAFTPDSRWLVTGDISGTLALRDITVQEIESTVQSVVAHPGAVAEIAVDPNGRWLASGGTDGAVRVWDLAASSILTAPHVLRAAGDSIITLAFSPDGRWLLADDLGTEPALLWDMQISHLERKAYQLTSHATPPAESPVVGTAFLVTGNLYAFSRDGHWLATIDANNIPHLWNLTHPDPTIDPRVLSQHDEGQPIIAAVTFSPDNRWLITAGYDKIVRLWDLAASPPAGTVYVFTGHELPVSTIAVTPDGRQLATAGGDRYVLLWDLGGERPSPTPRMLSPLPARVSMLATSPDNHWLIAASGNAAYLWDLTDPNPAITMLEMAGHDNAVSSVHVSRDSRWLVTVGFDGTARLWSLDDPQPRAAPVLLHHYWGGISAMAASADSQWLVTRSLAGSAHLWRLFPMADPALVDALPDPADSVRAEAFSPDSRWLVTSDGEGTAYMWDLAQSAPFTTPRLLLDHPNQIDVIAFSLDSRWLATASRDNATRLWSMASSGPSARPIVLQASAEEVTTVIFTPDNRWVITGGVDGTIWIYDRTAADISATAVALRAHKSALADLYVDPDSQWLVSLDDARVAHLWDLTNAGNAVHSQTLPIDGRIIATTGLGPDTPWLMVGNFNQTLRLWEIPPLSAEQAMQANSVAGALAQVLHGEAGVRLITVDNEANVRIWNLVEGQESREALILRSTAERLQRINALLATSDESWLLTGSDDGGVRLWPMRIEQLLQRACRTVGRDLTQDEWRQYLSDEPYHATCTDLSTMSR